MPLAAEQLYHLLGGLELGVVEVEYLAAVLRTYVGADAVGLRGVVDLEKEFTVKAEDQLSKCGWTPYEGETLKGVIEEVIINGKRIDLLK